MADVALAPSAALSGASSSRLGGLDRLRGFAVLLMIADHVLVVMGEGAAVRLTVTRLAMPLFFIVAGALVSRLTWRHAGVCLLGAALPLVVPWIDTPNVLVLYVLGVLVVLGCRAAGLPVWLPVVLALLVMANSWGARVATSYDVLAAVALVALGALLGRAPLAGLGGRLPAVLEAPGRFPLSIYVGHLLALQALVWASS